jgi:feruloyl esterase
MSTIVFATLSTVPEGQAATCQSLSRLKLADTVITIAQPIGAGEFTPPRNGSKAVPVAFCRVAGKIKPTSDSDIGFELWLPASGWTGRYESVGNGGFAAGDTNSAANFVCAAP